MSRRSGIRRSMRWWRRRDARTGSGERRRDHDAEHLAERDAGQPAVDRRAHVVVQLERRALVLPYRAECQYRGPAGALLFQTSLITPEILARGIEQWWYCVPRNGHISFYTSQALTLLATRHGLEFGSFSPELHVVFDRAAAPAWLSSSLRDSVPVPRRRSASPSTRCPHGRQSSGTVSRSITAAVSGRTPRHHANASAACSTSMPTPSAMLRTPALRASRRKGVSRLP